jgi:hypothetical protein
MFQFHFFSWKELLLVGMLARQKDHLAPRGNLSWMVAVKEKHLLKADQAKGETARKGSPSRSMVAANNFLHLCPPMWGWVKPMTLIPMMETWYLLH